MFLQDLKNESCVPFLLDMTSVCVVCVPDLYHLCERHNIC